MLNKLINAWYWIRSSFWFIPCLMILLAFALAATSLAFDRAVDRGSLPSLHGLYAGGPEGARELLSTVAGSMITVAGVVFSVTIVALSLASSQFGPRILRNFMREMGNQAVLGVFIATFVYCLLILRTVDSHSDGKNAQFVPQLSVSIGVLLALTSIVVLVYFIHHVSGSIQVDDIVSNIAAGMRRSTTAHPIARVGRDWDPARGYPTPAEPHGIWPAAKGGYLQSMDAEDILEFAVAHDLVLELLVRPGDFVTEGEPLVMYWPDRPLPERSAAEINRLFVLGAHRTPLQDFGYGINLLVEIAIRALSPSINDPFTALMCIDRLEQALVPMAAKPPPSAFRSDEAGRLRLIDHPPGFRDFLEMALDPIRQFGASNPVVVLRVLGFLRQAAAKARHPENIHALSVQARLFAREETWSEPLDRERVARGYRDFLAALRQDPRPPSGGEPQQERPPQV